jgi:D-alanyl-D-alanine carboxypeptidase
MNATARSLGMTHTRYTDPSGYDDATVSTAADQVRLVDRAMRLPVFASIVATPSATLPVVGTVHNTNTLLGHNGFVGVKTGSTAAAGGCFAFRAIRWIDGKRTTITGVVLGQPGHIAAGRRHHGRPHHRSSSYARSRAANLATTACARKSLITAARSAEKPLSMQSAHEGETMTGLPPEKKRPICRDFTGAMTSSPRLPAFRRAPDLAHGHCSVAMLKA